MAYRKTRLKLKHQDLAINVDIRTGKLSPDELFEQSEVIRRDDRTGSLVVRQIYDKETDDPLEEGYGYRWVNEDGDEVPKEDVQLYVIEDEEERPFEKHEPTLGGGRTLSAERWIPVATIDEYLVESIYEIWGEDDSDIAQLYELAQHIRDFDEAPVVSFVLQPSIYKKWGIITPVFFDDTFSLIIRVTNQKIEPEHAMPTLTADDVEAADAEEEAQTLEQQSPFE